jgi:hypothetical protein
MPHDLDRIEQRSLRRAWIAIGLGVIFVLSQWASLGDPPLGGMATAAHLGAWIAWAAVLGVFVAWGTGVLGGRRLARLLNDESTIEHRRKASEAGLRGALAAAFIVYAATFYETIAARDACRLLVTATIAPALLRFGWLELRALGRG